MTEVTIHLYCRMANGTIEDAQHTFDLSDFGAFLAFSGGTGSSIQGCQPLWRGISRRTVVCGPWSIVCSTHATPRTLSLS